MTVTVTQLPFAWKAAQDAIQVWASGIGLTAIWARQNAPRPTEPFVSLKISRFPSIDVAQQERIFTYDNAAQGYAVNVTGIAEFTCNVQVFCTSDNPDASMEAAGVYQQWTDAAGYCSALGARLFLPQTLDAFTELGMCAIDTGPVTVLDDIAFGEFDSRASFDLSMRIGSNYILTPAQSAIVPIEKTQFTGTTGTHNETDTVPNGA